MNTVDFTYINFNRHITGLLTFFLNENNYKWYNPYKQILPKIFFKKDDLNSK